MFLKTLLFSAVLSLSLSCATNSAQRMVELGYDPQYAAGFQDGESSGYMAAGNPYFPFRKNTLAFADGGQYHQGWTDGYDTAKSRYEATARSLSR